MAKTFEQMCDDVFHWECGLAAGEQGQIGTYSNTPGDHGGPTKWGITQATYAQFKGHPVTADDVKNMPESDAVAVYRRSFYQGPHFNLLPDGIQEEVFDIGVGSGPRRAALILQNVLNANDFPVAADGIIGPETVAQSNNAWTKYGPPFLGQLINAREAYYDSIVAHNPSQAKFARGWHNRAEMLRNEAAPVPAPVDQSQPQAVVYGDTTPSKELKPLVTSKTIAGGAAVVAGGAAQVAGQITPDTISDTANAAANVAQTIGSTIASIMHMGPVVIGIIIILGGAYIIYNRIQERKAGIH